MPIQWQCQELKWREGWDFNNDKFNKNILVQKNLKKFSKTNFKIL